MKRVINICLLFLLSISLLGCSQKEIKEETFKIGWFSPLTGNNATQGNAAMEAVSLYVEELNERGGLLGMPVEVIYYDDVSNTEEAIKIATKLIEVDEVDFVISSIISNCVLATGQIFENAEMPFFGMGFSPTFMQQGWEYCVRPTLNSSRSIPYLTTVMKEFGFESVAIFEGQDDYGASAGETMREACKKDNITVTTTESYASGDTDFSGQVAKILSTNPDCVFLGVLGGEVGNAMKQFRQFGYEGILFYSEPLQKDHYDIAGDATDHIAFAFPYVTYVDINDCSDNYMKDFLEKYSSKYGYLPKGEAAYRSWDAMTVLEKAVTNAGSKDGKDIIEAIYGIKDLQSLGGIMDFTKRDGECLDSFGMYVVVDRKSIAYETWKQSEDYKNYSEKMGWQ